MSFHHGDIAASQGPRDERNQMYPIVIVTAIHNIDVLDKEPKPWWMLWGTDGGGSRLLGVR
jgi:hypothetical protein